MRPIGKWVLAAVILAVFSIPLTAYTFQAHRIANGWIIDVNGEIAWRYRPSGSLFPWPREPGPLAALSRANQVDSFIYTYLIRSGALATLSVLMWICVGVCVFKWLTPELWHARVGRRSTPTFFALKTG